MSAMAAPSPFAAMLRRSKFASFDPLVAQVYTTHDGYAHRGDWGLKRPLPARKRGGFITVSAVDSREQQTEWKGAEGPGRWIKMWSELGREVRVPINESHVPWSGMVEAIGFHNWDVDSDFFAPGASAGVEEPLAKSNRRRTVPNVHAMSEKEFEYYIDRLRELRPAFRQWLQEEEDRNGKGRPVNLYALGQQPTVLHKHFIAQTMGERFYSPESRTLEQQPHPSAGLSYTHAPDLQNFFLTQPVPGHIVQQNRAGAYSGRYRKDKWYVAGISGMTTMLDFKNSEGKVAMDLGQRAAEEGVRQHKAMGTSIFRAIDARLRNAPTVVGPIGIPAQQGRLRQERLCGARIRVQVKGCGSPVHSRTNPHLPWTREYVAHEGDVVGGIKRVRVKPMKLRSRVPLQESPVPSTGYQILNTLQGIMYDVPPEP